MSLLSRTKGTLKRSILAFLYNKVKFNNYKSAIRQLNISSINHLDVGSGPTPKDPFKAKHLYGADLRSSDNNSYIKKCDFVLERLPYPDSTFDTLSAFDVVEHIPRYLLIEGNTTYPFIELMNEIWRVLKIDGVFFMISPCFPMKQAFQDPTHVNIFTEDTIRLYFCEKAWARIYGYYGSFSLVDEGWMRSHYWCLLKKSCNEAIIDLESPQQP